MRAILRLAPFNLSAALCLVAAGISPNILLADAAGLAVRRGVVVDDRLRTSDPRVYAVDDVAEQAGLWQASIELAKLAGVTLLGGGARYQPAPTPRAEGIRNRPAVGRRAPTASWWCRPELPAGPWRSATPIAPACSPDWWHVGGPALHCTAVL